MNTNQQTEASALSRRRNATKRLVLNALFAALYIVFSFLSGHFPTLKVSLTSVPIFLCAFLFGPLDAMAVAFVGTLIEQLAYGISPTMPLWMLPMILTGLFVGLLAHFLPILKNGYQKTVLYAVCLIGTVIVGELFLTAVNTGALYLDGYLMKYPVKALNLIIIPRLINCGLRAAVNCIVVYFLLPPVQKMINMRKNS